MPAIIAVLRIMFFALAVAAAAFFLQHFSHGKDGAEKKELNTIIYIDADRKDLTALSASDHAGACVRQSIHFA